ncbi:molecular chaperone HtpG [Tannerella sp. AF04-6]|jgi:molecular chaperone HtpG|uniref:molecular chaperone HtpG n=1 Tax=Coprobacter fastidiosus TaxID=1099853 RepID=UPI000ECD5F84|nr:molecular chaperone HtpG [Coprobacter fastidiosus]RHS47602.1 molecular chaperone HtpG [Tannerella sp. AF04-6]
MQKGTIGVTTDNIFPIIKKFLYSDHEIFLRELVSNAVDATQKLKTLSSFGDFKGELGEMNVKVSIDKKEGTLTISDHGIGMTAEEIDKYINQIAFSGAEEFLNKYKNDANAIIGHFGLGFYSSFMVAKKVEIRTLSYQENAKPVMWSCDGSPEYTMSEIDKKERGTDIVLYIDDENKEFLEDSKIESLLKKYCRFLPVPVIFGKEQEWKDGKYVDTDKDKIINDTTPAWTKKPTELTEEDYRKFYHDLYPSLDEPLFWIHLNVDYPFKLTGILYFPKIKNNLDINKNRIQLYSNQVFVTDSVEGIVPDFLMLLQGVIDSPDIPLNVSRSYLQSDSNVKKISTYITKKVADRLQEIFNNERKQFEEKWDDIKLFIEYGMLSDEKFYDRAQKFALLKDTDKKYYTLEEYKTLIEANQTDKDKNLIYIYATDAVAQYSYIEIAKSKGYDVLLMDGQLDIHFIGLLEQKLEKSRFVRVDSDIIDNLVRKNDKTEVSLDAAQRNMMTTVFKSQIPTLEKAEFMVMFEALGEQSQPVIITQNEFMRRMKDMSAMQPGMNFYGEMPDSFNLIINTEHPLSKKVIEETEKDCHAEIEPIQKEINELNDAISKLQEASKGKKDEEIPVTEKEELRNKEKEVDSLRKKESELLTQYANKHKLVRQLVDLALLSNNMLKGEALSQFIKRSVEML